MVPCSDRPRVRHQSVGSLHNGLAQTPSPGHGSEVQIYEKFRAWTTQQPSGGRDPSLLERLFHRSM